MNTIKCWPQIIHFFCFQTIQCVSLISPAVFCMLGVKCTCKFSEGKPTRMRRLCLKTFEAEGRGGLGITSSSEEVYELML